MTTPDQDRQRWRVSFRTLAGTDAQVTLCTTHRARNAGALALVGLPPHRAVQVRRGRCRNCRSTPR